MSGSDVRFFDRRLFLRGAGAALVPMMRALSFALDGLSVRQRATSNNIANVDTPGYKSQSVSFEEQLQAMVEGDTSAIPTPQAPSVRLGAGDERGGASGIKITEEESVMRRDGNNVDIEREMSTLAETQLRYQALTQVAGMRLALLKTIARDGR